MEALKRVRTFIKKKFRNRDFIRKVTMTSVILNMFHFQTFWKDRKCLSSHCISYAYEAQERGLD